MNCKLKVTINFSSLFMIYLHRKLCQVNAKFTFTGIFQKFLT